MTQKKSSSGKKGKKPTLSSATADNSGKSTPDSASKTSESADKVDKAANQAKEKAQATASNAKAASTKAATSVTTQATQEEKRSGGWVAPVALLFGLAGTGFSAYLWSQLKSLGESTELQLQSQAESAKTDVAGVKTELDEKAATLTSAIEEKTTALTGMLEEKSTTLTGMLQEKTEALSAALDSKASELTSSIQEKTTALDEKVVTLGDTLRSETSSVKTEIATTTASAVQELTSKTELEINNVSTSFNTGLALQRERSGKKFEEIEQKVSQLDESVKTTNELASRGQRDWVLAEVNYLLRTGVHRVKLAGDVKAGVIALESASDRLHTLGDIDYLPVREQIAEEVAALRRVGPPDIEGLIFKLEHMSKRADSLPLPPSEMQKAKEALKEDPAAATVSLGKSLMEKLNFSFDVSDSTGEPFKPRSKKAKPTKEQLTASDSLRLHLQAARLSALRHDSENFTNHMDNAISYAEQIFDQDNTRVTTYISDLSDLRETAIVPKIPALGSSLSLFTKIDSKRGSQ